MLSHPALFPALIRSDSESEALLAEKNVSTVSRVYGNNCVILRELADISLFGIDITFCMETANPIVAVTEYIENFLADTGHDSHVENNIDRVGKLNTDLCKRRTDRSH